jgi:hemerythrin
MAFKWDANLSVNVREIDDQHKRFVELINRLNDALNAREFGDNIRKILSEIETLAKLHFETEERYFKEFNYADAKDHIDEHNKLLIQVKELYAKHPEDNAALAFELIDFLEDWLINHLDYQDKKYTKCFNEHGLY